MPYSFTKENSEYSIELSKDEIVIPANILTPGAVLDIKITENGNTTEINDYEIDSVKRDGADVSEFYAHYTSKTWEKYPWSTDSKVSIRIVYNDVYGKELKKMEYKLIT